MHGDVSGLYQAYELMSIMLHSLDRVDDAGGFHLLKNDLRHLANRILFMDAHYIHRLPLDGKFLDSIHEDEQLSISNLFSVNRGLPDPHQSRLIVREYYRRRNLVKTFVEWYAIEPGFPAGTFGDDKMEPGMYVNGGLLPIAGGELALASIKYGYPDYGAHILQRYFTMIDKTGESWFWYGPRGKPPDDFTASWFDGWKYDCWGASSMMNALIQSMAGVRCERPGYSQVWLEPHWNITGVIDAEVTMEFEESGDRFHYLYKYDEDKKRTRIEINSENLRTLYIAVSDALESYTIESAGKTLNGEIIIRDYSRAIEVEVESGHEIKIEIMES
jgi:hypothetical protein